MDRSELAKIYNHLKTSYGAAFIRSFPSDCLEGWYGEMRRHTVNEGMLGAAKWVSENPDRYPNLPQLLRMIRNSTEARERGFVANSPQPGSAEWLRDRERNRAVSKPFIDRLRKLSSENDPYRGSSADQRKRALIALKTPGPEGTKRAHRILVEHLQQPIHREDMGAA